MSDPKDGAKKPPGDYRADFPLGPTGPQLDVIAKLLKTDPRRLDPENIAEALRRLRARSVPYFWYSQHKLLLPDGSGKGVADPIVFEIETNDKTVPHQVQLMWHFSFWGFEFSLPAWPSVDGPPHQFTAGDFNETGMMTGVFRAKVDAGPAPYGAGDYTALYWANTFLIKSVKFVVA